jgi:serine/threonine protein kinase
MSLSAGTHLGPYEVVGAIGAGGMGEVYQARDSRLKRTVAIKVLPRELSGDAQRRARLEREARAMASLSHPRICTLFDVGEHDGSTFLVMELLEGDSLAERLKRGPLPLPQALEIAAHVAEALDAAHQRGIVHRDLKPGNVMLTRSGAKVLDFGLAKLRAGGDFDRYASTEAEPLTGTGAVMGTLQYMAPEQLEGKEVDAAPAARRCHCSLHGAEARVDMGRRGGGRTGALIGQAHGTAEQRHRRALRAAGAPAVHEARSPLRRWVRSRKTRAEGRASGVDRGRRSGPDLTQYRRYHRRGPARRVPGWQPCLHPEPRGPI